MRWRRWQASEGRWSPAVSRPSPTTATSAQQMPLATVIERVPPVNATQIASNSSHDVWLYDFGQNMVGTIELQPLPAAISGSQLALTHGEWLETWRRNHSAVQRCDPQTCSAAESDGEYIVPVVSGGLQVRKRLYSKHILPCHNVSKKIICQDRLRTNVIKLTQNGAFSYDQTVLHTLRENISHPLAPIFAWHGFQYVTIVAEHGTSFKGGLEALTALRIHTNVSVTGELDFGGDGIAGSESENSAEVFNGVQKMLTASQLSNLAAYIPMSCPTTEKQVRANARLSRPRINPSRRINLSKRLLLRVRIILCGARDTGVDGRRFVRVRRIDVQLRYASDLHVLSAQRPR